MAGSVRQARLPTPASALGTLSQATIAGASKEDPTRVPVTLQDPFCNGGVPPRPRNQLRWAANELMLRSRFALAGFRPGFSDGSAPGTPMCQNRTQAKCWIIGGSPL